MQKRFLRVSYLALLLLFPVLAGCRSLFGPPALPRDPLFVNRKPLEVKSPKAAAKALVRTEPQLPPFPTAFLAARARELEINANALDAHWPPRRAPSRTPGILTSHPKTEPSPEKQEQR